VGGNLTCGPGLSVARVTAVDRDRFLVRDDERETPAELTGKYLYATGSSTELPCVGDWVCVRYRDEGAAASIHGLLPRKSFLRRKTPGKDVEFQMIAANVDIAFVIQSCQFDFNVRRLERYLVMVREGRIDPVVLLTKTDLVGDGELQALIDRIRGAGIGEPILTLSSMTGDGLDRVRALLAPGKTYCLLGSSGVGKSTLINRLAGGSSLETQAVSHTGEGRHTTTRRHLIPLEGGAFLIDMPGMRELGMIGVAEGLDDTFIDIGELARRCRFTDCGHSSEPGCAVREAIERGDLAEARLQDYLKLRKESAFHDLSYVERRKRDKAFGRHVKAILDEKSRRR
jgi:ribosome biogenesis GTPase